MDGVTGASLQQFSNEGMLKFFVQLISITKHMVDDILPDLLLLMDKSTIDTIKGHCEEFDGSLHVFTKLCGVVSRKNLSLLPVKPSVFHSTNKGGVTPKLNVEPTSSDNVGNNIKRVEDNKMSKSQSFTVTNFSDSTLEENLIDDNVWESLVDKVKTEFNESKKLSTFYYCGLCTVRYYDNNTWAAHLRGKCHTKRNDEVANIKIACDICGFNIIGDDQHVAMIMESPHHRSLDELIARENVAFKTPGSASVENSSKDIPANNPTTSAAMPKSDGPVGGKTNNGDVVSLDDIKRQVVSKQVCFKGISICPSFCELTVQIRTRIESSKNFTACFCRPCDAVCKSKNSWLQHISEIKHVSMMKNKTFNNTMCMCLQCDFGIVGSKIIVRGYMCYHIENCHQQSTDNIKDAEYMTMREITPKIQKIEKKQGKKKSSDSSSIKGSTGNGGSILDVRCGSSGRATPHSGHSTPSAASESGEQRKHVQPVNNLQEVVSRSSSSASLRGNQSSVGRCEGSSSNSARIQSSVCDMEVDDSYRDSTNRPRSPSGSALSELPPPQMPPPRDPPKSVVSEDNDMVAPFIVMLRHKEAKFLEEKKKYKPFSALCLLCPTDNFKDSFVWSDHVWAHSSSDTQNEVDCSFCNSHIYGNVAEIRERLIFHDEHMRIDRLMK